MVIRSVSLTHLRNHSCTVVPCAGDVTILSGPNGSGKTSILEAISLCSLAQSFVPVSDNSLVARNEEECTARVVSVRDRDVPYNVSVTVRPGMRKRIVTDIVASGYPRDIIGELPVVALSPDHKSITFGGPAERRSFLDAVMAQSSKRYTELLYEHRRILKQRNAVLATGSSGELLDVWTEQFITVSAEIVDRRAKFVKDLAEIVCSKYEVVSGSAEKIDMVYQPDVAEHGTLAQGETLTNELVLNAYRSAATQLRQRELQRETTLFGPQKDEIVFRINGGLVRDSASQGQHKSLLVALKLAECVLLNDCCNERPVVLLDDVFSELDSERCRRVLQSVLKMNMQCFVTTTDGDSVMGLLRSILEESPGQTTICLIAVQSGMITITDTSMLISQARGEAA